MTDVYAGGIVKAAHNGDHESRIDTLEGYLNGLGGPVETTWTTPVTMTTTETLVKSVTFTAVASARYRFTADHIWYCTEAGNNVTFNVRYASGASVTSSSTLKKTRLTTSQYANYNVERFSQTDFTGLSAGQYTIGLFAVRGFGGGTVGVGHASADNAIRVERVPL